MQTKQKNDTRERIFKGLELAEYRMLKEKALHNQMIVQGTSDGGTQVVSARKVFKQLYGFSYRSNNKPEAIVKIISTYSIHGFL